MRKFAPEQVSGRRLEILGSDQVDLKNLSTYLHVNLFFSTGNLDYELIRRFKNENPHQEMKKETKRIEREKLGEKWEEKCKSLFYPLIRPQGILFLFLLISHHYFSHTLGIILITYQIIQRQLYNKKYTRTKLKLN